MAVSRVLAGWMLIALVAVQTLGQVHRVAHAPGLHADHAHEAHAHDEPGHAASWIAGLFGGHEGTTECRLFDQSPLGDASGVVVQLVLPSAPPAALLAFFQGEAVARRAALFEARGPPSFR